jgi:hypothetical protein
VLFVAFSAKEAIETLGTLFDPFYQTIGGSL